MLTFARVTIAALALTLAACSSSGGGSKGAASASSTSSAPASAASSSAASSSAASTSSPSTSDVSAKLLTAAEVGDGFTATTYTPNNNPLPCGAPGSPSFDARAPTDVSAGTDLLNGTLGAQFSEQIRVYPDTGKADAALAIGTAGLNCARGHLYATDGTAVPVKISKPQDLSADLGAPAVGWQITSAQVDALFVGVESGTTVLVMSFVRAPGSDTSKLPNPFAVAKAAVDKAKG